MPHLKLDAPGQLERPIDGQNLDGEGMNAPLYFPIERFHDSAVLRNAAKTDKMPGRDSDAEVGFPCFAPAGMALVAVGFVDDFKVSGRVGLGQLVCDGVAYGHDLGAPF